MPKVPHPAEERQEELPLSKAAEYLLDECRMVLPGIQALFGFQLIAVFNSGFEKLGASEQRLHLAAVVLVAMAIAIIMTPAALHRQKGPQRVTETFIRISSRLLLWSMTPLALAITIDFYLVGRLIAGVRPTALLAAALFALFSGFWYVLPRSRRLQAALARPRIRD